MQAAPKIVILAIGTAEKRAEIVELDAFKRGCGATLANRGAVLGGNAVHFDRVEFVQAFVLQQGQSRNIVKRIA